MNCKEHSHGLMEVALGGAQDEGLRAHLADCSACCAELERLRELTGTIDRSIREMANVEPSPGFAVGVRARFAEVSAARAAWWRGWIPALASGAAVLALVAWFLWSASGVQAPETLQAIAGARHPSKGAEPLPSKREAPSFEPSRSAYTEPPKVMAASSSRRGSNLAPKAEPHPVLPEVLVSGDEWNQVVKLYALAQRGQVEAETLMPPDGTPLEQKFQPLVVAQLQPIAPLSEPPPASGPRK